MAPHSSTFAWKIPWTWEPGRLQSMGSLESDMIEQLHFHFSLSCTGEGNGNPLQCSCLENPRDGGTWWAAIYGVAQSQTRLKWFSSLAAPILQADSLLSEPPGKPLVYFAAKSFQSCPTLCDPIDSSLPGSPVPGVLQARTLEWVTIAFSDKLWAQSDISLA